MEPIVGLFVIVAYGLGVAVGYWMNWVVAGAVAFGIGMVWLAR